MLPTSSIPGAPTPPRRGALSGTTWSELGRGTASVLIGLPVAVVGVSVSLALGLAALGLLIVYPVALPVLYGWVATVRGLAWLERRRVSSLLGYTIAPPPSPDETPSWHRRLWDSLRHHDTWRAFAYHLVRLPVAIVTTTIVAVAWTAPAAFAASSVVTVVSSARWWGDGGRIGPGLGVATAIALVCLLIGTLLLSLIPRTVRAVCNMEAALAAALLGPSGRDELDGRVRELTTSRSDLVDIADRERRRIERDLHDGAGQQLVSLAMTLGMAREKLATDPDRARSLIDEAHTDAKQALVGLREIVRGISPAILSDRGLGAALSAVAARSAIPVALAVDVPDRPDPAIEGIAYYIVCEGLSNAIRHAAASHLRVRVVRAGDLLEVEVEDDGGGGADPTRGTGLRGLTGRVAAVDGTFHLDSPDGGPTRLHVVLPTQVGEPVTGTT